jgi:aryl-alcohol dehydrogenase-like predicted oxidoreductase
MAISRRDLLRLGAGAGATLVFNHDGFAIDLDRGTQAKPILKKIPSSGEMIPAVGLGTSATFQAAARTPAEHAALSEVMKLFTDLGGAVIDTAPSYGTSEETIGTLAREIGNADRIFIATKISGATGRDAGIAQLERSIERNKPGNIDLNQVHNLGDWQTQLGVLRDAKKDRKIRYLGVTTSSDRQYEQLEQVMRGEQLDFIQIDYAIDNRNAEERILPLAIERGAGVLVNGPFGRNRLFRRIGDRPVPEWGKEIGATTWAQVALKWLLGHPAITVVIPATSDVAHMRDNMGAGVGELPDAALRKRIADFIDALPA